MIPPFVIGLTGGIGSGKSTVSAMFAGHGINIIDADQIAREVTEPNTPGLKALVKHFGPSLLRRDQTLDRAKLRDIIFQDHEARHTVESILHPLILQTIEQRISETTSPYCIAVIPLLAEVQCADRFDRILVIDTTQALQYQRITARDDLTWEQAEAILDTQCSRVERLDLADDIIINNEDLKQLQQQIERAHAFYLKLAVNRQ